MKILRFFLFFLLSVTSCVYSFRGFSGVETYRVFVDLFRNASEKAGIEADVTRWVIHELEQDVRISLVSENKAKYKFIVTLKGYRVEPQDYKPDGTVLSYKVIIISYLTVEDLSSQTKVVEDKMLSSWGTYASLQSEEEGLKIASQDLARRIMQEFLNSVSR
ncbi:MAG: LPS assembly lipoprotein LptE [candidate division WOR-3 bacterium]